MKCKAIVFLSCLLVVQASFAQADTVLNRYKQYLFKTFEVSDNAGELLTSLTKDGQWNDINYQDQERGGWKPLLHLKRLRQLAYAYANPQSKFYHQTPMLQSIKLALEHWLLHRYKCPNWWHNEIGVPQQMRDIIILVGPSLSATQLQGALEVLGQYRIQNNSTGANLTWTADLGLHYGLLTKDSALVQRCRNLLINEIKITTGDGVQPDYSFHQHDKRLQMYQYGAAFLKENVRLAWELRGTALAFPKEKINVLTDFLLQGWQWMARGINTVSGTMDRSASRKNALHSADIRELLPFFMELAPDKKTELSSIANHQNGKGALNGFRYYPYSDFAAYQQPGFSFFVKTISTRTLATESINSENLKGRLLNSGDAYFIHNGEEYFNLMPAWNWDCLPGITSFKGADKIIRKDFAGSVTDGNTGFTSMDYVLASKDGSTFISAKKSWFCYGKTVVCLIADLKGEKVDTAYTAMDQSRWRGPVTANEKSNKLAEGNHLIRRLKWVHHANFVYVPLDDATADVRLQNSTAKWSGINTSESDEPVNEKVFMPLLLQTNLRKSQSFGYIAAFCKTPAEANRIAKNTPCKIIRNDSSCQAVSFPGNGFMFAFFGPASVDFKGKRLSVDKPCLLLLKDNKMYASDPLQSNSSVKVQLDNNVYDVWLPANGFSTEGLPLK